MIDLLYKNAQSSSQTCNKIILRSAFSSILLIKSFKKAMALFTSIQTKTQGAMMPATYTASIASDSTSSRPDNLQVSLSTFPHPIVTEAVPHIQFALQCLHSPMIKYNISQQYNELIII